MIALLMDGPQLRSRWSSRYATLLAEDPGCSVLSLTSLGMTKRSEPAVSTERKDRTIALWRDAHYGAREIELDEGAIGCVLSLVCHAGEEFTADGRGDEQTAFFPVFGGVHSIALDR